MELKYKTQPLHEGGSAVSGCGTIHISEIKKTLTNLSDDLEFPFDLNEFVLGSTGKSEYSGDIDLVLDNKHWGNGPMALYENLVALFGKANVSRNGSMVHLKYPISGYDPVHNKRLPRTGFVQIDFNFGNVDWERLYHYSPGSESGYKGAHRNLAMSAIAGAIDLGHSEEFDSYDRPVSQRRWKWGPNGFFKVDRTSVRDKQTGKWNRKQPDTVLEGPYLDGAFVAKVLFPIDGTVHDFHSLETLLSAVKRNYGVEHQEKVFERIARYLSDRKDWENFEYPPEIDRYLQIKDK